jgi:type I restriction enzyme M protein
MAVLRRMAYCFRGAAEGHIKEVLIEIASYIDAIIGLPSNVMARVCSKSLYFLVLKNARNARKHFIH